VNLLPPSGPQRNRQLVLLALLLVTLIVVIWRFVLPEMGSGDPAAAAVRTSNPQARHTNGAASAAASSLPEPLKLASLEPVPDEPKVGRNPFLFGVRPAPSAPPAPPTTYTPPAPPPQPAWPPPIALKLVTIVDGPDGRRQANLKDPASNTTFVAVEGSIVDGRYKVVKVAQQSVVVSYVDGSGQRTLTLGG